jgi:hypothetical protein
MFNLNPVHDHSIAFTSVVPERFVNILR